MNAKTQMPWSKRMRRLIQREVTLQERKRRIEQQLAGVYRQIETEITVRKGQKESV
jgi:predicted secreted protein